MTLTFFNGTITTTTSEQNLFNITGNAHYATYVFTHNMASGDTMVIKVYVTDVNATTERLYQTITLTDAQSEPAGFISFLPATTYRVSIQKTVGTNRVITWLRTEVT
jgi:hypothetical protein